MNRRLASLIKYSRINNQSAALLYMPADLEQVCSLGLPALLDRLGD